MYNKHIEIRHQSISKDAKNVISHHVVVKSVVLQQNMSFSKGVLAGPDLYFLWPGSINLWDPRNCVIKSITR